MRLRENKKWCSLVYEFLPDFCYTCGVIGHTDRMCEMQLEKGVVQQYGKSLRFIPEKKRTSEEIRGSMAKGDNNFLGEVVPR